MLSGGLFLDCLRGSAIYGKSNLTCYPENETGNGNLNSGRFDTYAIPQRNLQTDWQPKTLLLLPMGIYLSSYTLFDVMIWTTSLDVIHTSDQVGGCSYTN